MRKYLTMVVLLLMSISMFAQQHSVKGTVVDQNGVPVIGMTVMEQGTQNGTTTALMVIIRSFFLQERLLWNLPHLAMQQSWRPSTTAPL